MEARQYRGYYIDNVVFSSKKDIDEFIKKQAVDRFAMLNKYFAEKPSMEASIACSEQARYLHDEFGFSWEQIEQLEIETLKQIS